MILIKELLRVLKSKAMKICEYCGVTEETTRVYNSDKYGGTFCHKHCLQLLRYGKCFKTIYDPNDYIEHEDCFEIITRDVKGNQTNSFFIDKEDYEKCKQYKWYNSRGYGKTTVNGKKVWLHRHLLDVGDFISYNEIVDHKNGNTSDNRKYNLRVVNNKENMQNIHKEYKTVGVHYGKYNGNYRWIPSIMVDGKSIWLGTCDTEEEAIIVRKNAEKKYFTPIE